MEAKPVGVDKPAELEDKQVERPEEPKVAERRADKLEVLEIRGSGITPEDGIQMMSPGGGSRISLAIKTGSNSFSNRL